jgi:hypothetical protein
MLASLSFGYFLYKIFIRRDKLFLMEILAKIINHTNEETNLEALHPGKLWQGVK